MHFDVPDPALLQDPLPEVDMDCTKLEWNPLTSAPSHSQLAGVLAGLVLTGIVVLFNQGAKPQRSRAIVLFSGALLALAFDSFIFGVIAGEQVCPKAWTETMPAAGLLGLGALGIFGGISWLFSAYDDGSGRTTRLAIFMTYTVAIIAGYHLQVTAASYLIDMRSTGLNTPPDWLETTVDIYAWAIVAVILLFASVRWLLDKRNRYARGSIEDREERYDKAATRAAYLSVIYVIAVAAMSGTLLSRTYGEWIPSTPTYVVASSTVLSLAIPTLALIAQLGALPHGQKNQRQAGDGE